MAYPLPPITKVNFPATQYFAEETTKKQIYLHHTAGNSNAKATFQGWASNQDKIATCVAISGKGAVDGEIVQGFSSKHWGYHLGLKQAVFTKHGVPYQSLDKISIGIEICNWGWLTERNGKFYTYVNSEVPADQVIKLDTPYKGQSYWHDYTDAQIKSVKELLLLWNDRYNIPLDYNEDIWDVTKRALKGDPGVYTHNSVRVDKTDVYPHPGLIEMLKSL